MFIEDDGKNLLLPIILEVWGGRLVQAIEHDCLHSEPVQLLTIYLAYCPVVLR